MPFISSTDGDLKTAFVTNAWLIDQFVGNRLFTWGNNLGGGLATNTSTSRSSPTQVVGLAVNWKQVDYGYYYGAGIKTDGTLWCWGYNTIGNLGTNNLTSTSSPVQTVSLTNNWTSVACGYSFTAAIKNDGSLWTWGSNNIGQLGDNTTTHRSSPVQTVSYGNNWKQVDCGPFGGGGGSTHMAGIKTDGTLWTWGYNFFCALGDNSTTDRSSPVQTISRGTNWQQVSCGQYHTGATKIDGTLWMWGFNYQGQLGNNTAGFANKYNSPIQTVSFGTNWKQVACGQIHTAAIKKDGTLWTWGRNDYGQLGDNTTNHRSSPVQTVTFANNWKQVTCGTTHTLAIKNDGTLWCWGLNSSGQLGDNTITDKSSPVQTFIRGSNWKQAAGGESISMAVTYGD